MLTIKKVKPLSSLVMATACAATLTFGATSLTKEANAAEEHNFTTKQYVQGIFFGTGEVSELVNDSEAKLTKEQKAIVNKATNYLEKNHKDKVNNLKKGIEGQDPVLVQNSIESISDEIKAYGEAENTVEKNQLAVVAPVIYNYPVLVLPYPPVIYLTQPIVVINPSLDKVSSEEFAVQVINSLQ